MKATLLAGAFVSFLSVSAFGADLGVPVIAPIAPLPFTWTGCYAAAQAAGGWGQKDLNDSAGIVSPISGFTSANLNISGYPLGAQLGCDYQFASHWVVGFEGAASGGNIGSSIGVATPGASRRQRDLPGEDRSVDQRHRARGLRMEQLVALRQGRRRLGERPLQRIRRTRHLRL